jgi:endonuclease YncB( thermonuclease family)
MSQAWLRLARIAVLSLCLACSASWGTEHKTKKWVMLTGCQCVTHPSNDGDSFRVRCGDTGFIARLYFVDAPETNLGYPERTREQAEYFGATLDQTMKAGKEATDLVRQTLREPFTVWTRWGDAGGRSKERRYYALVQVNHTWLDEILVSKGLARRKGSHHQPTRRPELERTRGQARCLGGRGQEAADRSLGQVDTGRETVRGEARG